MKAEMTEREVMIDRWSKVAGISYDMKNESEILQIFQGKDHGAKREVLGSYGLAEKDVQDFMTDLGNVLLSGWWVGHEFSGDIYEE